MSDCVAVGGNFLENLIDHGGKLVSEEYDETDKNDEDQDDLHCPDGIFFRGKRADQAVDFLQVLHLLSALAPAARQEPPLPAYVKTRFLYSAGAVLSARRVVCYGAGLAPAAV